MKLKRPPQSIILAACLALGALQEGLHATLLTYTATPDATPSPTYTSVTVDGTSVGATKFGDLNYARFAFTGTATLAVSTGTLPITSYSISPQSYGVAASVTGSNTLNFTLSQPKKLIISVTSGTAALEKLLILTDPPEITPPQLTDPDVDNVQSVLPSGWATNQDTVATSEINAAIAVSASNGHILYFPSGKYRAGQITIPSNARLYFESGALLKAITGTTGSTSYPFPTSTSKDSSFLYLGGVAGANSIQISGRGIIDGNGYQIRSQPGDAGNSDTIHNIKLMRADTVTNLNIQDIFFRDSARWTLHILKSGTVSLKNIKVVNDLSGSSGSAVVTNTDAVDADASNFVTVENSILYTYDDAFSPKVSGQLTRLATCHDLVFKNNVLRSQGCAMRIGSETVKDIYNVVLDNNDIYNADRFLGLELGAGAGIAIHDIVATNNRVEAIGGGSTDAFFFNRIDVYPNKYNYSGTNVPSNYPGTINNNTVNGLYALDTATHSDIRGQQETISGTDTRFEMTNFYVKNMYISGTLGVTFSGTGSSTATPQNPVPFYFKDYHYTSGGQTAYTPLAAAFSNVVVTAPGADGSPTVEVAATDDWASETGDNGTFTISRLGAIENPLVVNFTLTGSAINGTDYTTVATSATIPAGASQTSVTIIPLPDALTTEGNESVILTLGTGTAYAVSSTFSSGTLTIADGPAPPPTETVNLAIQDGSAHETVGAPGSPTNDPGKYKFTRSSSGTTPLSVNFTVSGSATRGTDYTLNIVTVSGTTPVTGNTVTMPTGTNALTVELDGIYDGVAEGGGTGNESAIMTLSAGSGYTSGTSTSGTVIIHDTP
ncbi:hypothetical protein BH09VER1_BH09VER1_03740 [soil metagenome]